MAKAKKNTQTKAEAEARGSLIINGLPGYFLIACLLVTLYFFTIILAPFLTVLFLAAVLVIAFYPLFKFVRKTLKGYGAIASILCCLLVVIVVVAPITTILIMLITEAVDVYDLIQVKIGSGVFDKYLLWEDGGIFYELKHDLDPILRDIGLNEVNVKDNIVNAAEFLSTFIVSQAAVLVKGISGLLFSFFVMLFAMYYFFKDGESLVDKIKYYSPLPSFYETQLFNKLGDMVKAIVVGVFFTAIIQGTVGGIGFAIAGVPSPVFWGATMAFLSLVPLVGTALVWVPAAIIFAIMGDYGWAIFTFLWGFFAVGAVDNFIRPYLIGGKAHTYPLLTFFVIMGGIFVMGLKGIIVGPLVLMALMSLLHIYEAEYSKVLKR